MATEPDFWGELEVEDIRTPATMLREQAALLAPKMQYILEAKVETEVSGAYFTHSFLIVVPALDNYVYELFKVRHQIDLYPLTILSDLRIIDNEDHFADWLRGKLSSPQTRRIITNLLSQAKGA
jgi:hypothetical protein